MEGFKSGALASAVSFEIDQSGSVFEAMSDVDPTHLSDKSFPEGIYTSPSEASSPGWGSQELNSFYRLENKEDSFLDNFHDLDSEDGFLFHTLQMSSGQRQASTQASTHPKSWQSGSVDLQPDETAGAKMEIPSPIDSQDPDFQFPTGNGVPPLPKNLESIELVIEQPITLSSEAGPRRKSSTSSSSSHDLRRRAQNRASQRAFRQRREYHAKRLEQQLAKKEADYAELVRSHQTLREEIEEAFKQLASLRG